MDAVKERLQVPSDVWGCHTAVVDGYYLEGHVPLEAAEKLLKERPPVAGLAVAGMPKGSLGMEIGRAHVRTPVTNAQLVCRLLLAKNTTQLTMRTRYNNNI